MDRLARHPRPLLVDEWQRLPSVWDRVRRMVDDGAQAGSFLLTGSAVPKAASYHSGAGRIVDLRMRPLSLAERGLVDPTVSLTDLLEGGRPEIVGASPLTVPDYAEEILASGLPGIRALSGRVRRAQLDAYLNTVVMREFAEQGLMIRRPEILRAWLAAYAAATATTTSYNKIARAASPGQERPPSRDTTVAYRDVLSQLWLLDPVPAWIPSNNTLSRLGRAPKHQLADPALAARLVEADMGSLLEGRSSGPAIPRRGTQLGALFEHLVGLSLSVYAQAAEARLAHLRASGGDHEVDFVIHKSDRVIAIEVKLTPSVVDQDVRHLHWLEQQIGARMLDKVVITTGPEAYRRSDGVAVIPAALLGP